MVFLVLSNDYQFYFTLPTRAGLHKTFSAHFVFVDIGKAMHFFQIL